MKKARLEEITISITDGKHGDCKPDENSGYYFISCKDVHDGIIDYSNARQITQEDFADTHRRTLLEPNDILITNSGTIGRMALVKDRPETNRTTFQKSVAIVKPDTSKVVPKYLYYRLRDCVNDFVNQSNGSAQKNLLLGTMRNFSISYPEDKDAQKRLAEILGKYDDLIENNQKQIKLLEEAAQRLYKEWFVDFHFPGNEKTEIVDGVPEGWHIGTVQEIIEYHDTKRKPLSGQQREKMKGNYRYYGAAGILDYVNAFLFDGIYLLLGEDGTVVSDNGCPILQYVTGKFWVNNHAHVLTGKGRYSTEYIYMMFAHMKILDVVTGVAQPKISQGRLSTKKILIPASELVVTFDVNAKPIFDEILILENQIIKLEEARDRLLPKLMSGEIEV